MAFRQPLILTNATALPLAGNVGTRTFYHPGNVRIHGINLMFLQGQDGALGTPAPATRAQIIAALLECELAIGTQTPRKFTAQELFYMLDMSKENFVAGVLPIYFSDPKCATVLGEELTAWDLHGIHTNLEIKLKLKMPAAGTYFDVRAVSSIDGMRNTDSAGNFIGRFIRYARWTDKLEAGTKSYFGLQRTMPWHRLWIFGDAPIKRVVLKLNGSEIFDRSNTVNLPELAAQLAQYGMVIPHANVFPVILNANNQINDRMMVNEKDTLELITEADTPVNVSFIQEQQSPVLA